MAGTGRVKRMSGHDVVIGYRGDIFTGNVPM